MNTKPCIGVLQQFSGWLSKNRRRESAHAQNFQFKIPTKRARMREFSSRFLDNQPENCCTRVTLLPASSGKGTCSHVHARTQEYTSFLAGRLLCNKRTLYHSAELSTGHTPVLPVLVGGCNVYRHSISAGADRSWYESTDRTVDKTTTKKYYNNDIKPHKTKQA